MKPLISVLTATWNRDSFLPGAIESVMAQTYPNWELLIVDDGSTDETNSILSRITHPRVKSWRQTNSGQSAALNFALSQAKGELIAFLDSDDELMPHHLELLEGEIGNHDFVLGKFELVNCDPNTEPLVRDFYCPNRLINVNEIEVITGVLFGRRSVFSSLGGFRSVPSTDTDLFQRMREREFSWKKCTVPSYRYFFSRDQKSMAAKDRFR